MPDSQEKLKEYWQEKSEQIATKIEKTPMERFFVFFLIIITGAAIVLGYFQLRQNLNAPLYPSFLAEERGKLRQQYQVSNTNATDQDVLKLQSQDSDLDGLSDYSEIYLYKTSPYLEDSDSDGIWDKQEVLAGTNPNCAEGEDCGLAISQTQSIPETSSVPSLENINQAPSSFDMSDLVGIESQLLSGELNLSDLGIDDPALQQILEQVRESEIQDVDQVSEEDKDQAIESLGQLTPDQIRQELLSRGIDESALQQISDEQLMDIFNQTLNLYQ